LNKAVSSRMRNVPSVDESRPEVKTITNSKGQTQTEIGVSVIPLSQNQNFDTDKIGTLRFTVTDSASNSYTGYQDVPIHFSLGSNFGGHEDTGLVKGSDGDQRSKIQCAIMERDFTH